MDLRHIASLRWTAGVASLFHVVFSVLWFGLSCMCGALTVMGGAFLTSMAEHQHQDTEPLSTLVSLGAGIIIVSSLLGFFAMAQTYSLIRFGVAVGSKRVRASVEQSTADPALLEGQREDLRKGARYFTIYTVFDTIIALLACVAVGIAFAALS